ncbi:MAG: hypothetical protein EOO25_12090 [Comamonadaceae bacterium]|nr:MAG: hypothetical protein EOO25_12090 [Comamonadaceae bacterium]
MQLAYDLQWLDYLKFTLAHQFSSLVAQCFFTGIGAVLGWQFAQGEAPQAVVPAAVAIYCGLWMVQAAFTALYLWFGKNPSLLTRHRFEIGDAGFADETEFGRHEHLWPAVTRAAERLGNVALYVDAHIAYIVPARAFESPAQRAQFLATVAAARAGAPVPVPLPPSGLAPAGQQTLGVLEWLAAGLSAGFLLRPRVERHTPGPWQFLVVLAVVSLAQIAAGRLEISGDAEFNLRVWLSSWWTAAALVLAGWLLVAGLQPQTDAGPHPVARWLALWLPATVPVTLAGSLIAALHANDNLAIENAWLAWGLYAGLVLWALAVCFITARSFLPALRAAVLTVVLLCCSLVMSWQFPDRIWYSAGPAADAAEQPRLKLSQEVFEQQQALWARSAQNLAPDRPDVADVYAIVFAPYAGEDVFLRESSMVVQVLGERFDAVGRTLHLVNHATTAATHLWATPANLQRAVQAVAARMDRSNDILMVYMTSHGAQDFKLAASHWPLEVAPVAPALLRAALDEAGIRHRVIAVSACYSGGWIAPLASETSLVMTASDATHTSYGCGRKSQLTFFGRAVFDEQLRKTRSFEQAFAAAVPIIDQREKDGGKPDGFSNPQISVGESIRPVLQSLERRLEQRVQER